MRKKLIGIIIIVGLLITTLPIAIARYHKNIGATGLNKYSNCYVEISGLQSINDYPRIIGVNNWKIIFLRTNGASNPEAFVFYWYILFDETSEISIYNEKNGELLWQHDGNGEPIIRMLRFSGDYITSLTEEGRLKIDISGQIRTIWINEY